MHCTGSVSLASISGSKWHGKTTDVDHYLDVSAQGPLLFVNSEQTNKGRSMWGEDGQTSLLCLKIRNEQRVSCSPSVGTPSRLPQILETQHGGPHQPKSINLEIKLHRKLSQYYVMEDKEPW